MKINEILTEATNLTANELYKRNNVDIFLKKVELLSPFKKIGGGEVTVDPADYDRLADFLKNKKSGSLEIRDLNSDQMMSTGKLVKTTEFGGATATDTGAKAGVKGKEAYQIKPSQVLGDGSYNAKTLSQAIIGNSVLSQDEAGVHVIEMARQIASGMPCRMPSGPGVTAPMTAAIHDYAGEYLGVLALVKGLANFAAMDQFLQHLDIDSISSLNVSFPQESNSPLADSIGRFINAATGNEILISSKGRGGGAAPSITSLKVPDEFRKKRAYQMEIAFIDLCQNQSISAKSLPFHLSNFLHDNEKMPKWMPRFTEEDIQLAVSLTGNKFKGHYTDGLNQNLMTVINNVKWGAPLTEQAQPGLVAAYGVEKTVIDVVNKGGALPQFESLAREILQKNFIQINAVASKGNLSFNVLWPNKQMATGKILLATKNSTAENNGKLSFKIK